MKRLFGFQRVHLPVGVAPFEIQRAQVASAALQRVVSGSVYLLQDILEAISKISTDERLE